MNFEVTPLEGVRIIEPEKHEDTRGFFARTFDKAMFLDNQLRSFDIVQTSISYNKKKGTLRGMHYQYGESKIIQCVKGSIHDVIIDIRDWSKTHKKSFSVELNDRNNKMLYIPYGFAHGFQTLEDNTIVLYYMNAYYNPECSRTIPYNDIKYNIEWKLPVTSISEKDSCSCLDSDNLDSDNYNYIQERS